MFLQVLINLTFSTLSSIEQLFNCCHSDAFHLSPSHSLSNLSGIILLSPELLSVHRSIMIRSLLNPDMSL